MHDKTRLLRQLPGVDEVLEHLRPYDHSHTVVVETVRAVIDQMRSEILCGTREEVNTGHVIEMVKHRLHQKELQALRKVINATGTLLHTNLGRAPASLDMAEYIKQVITGYCSLELDLETGKRGDRGEAVRELLKIITGAESAVVVNNNAAAVFITLKVLASGREVVISRGELVEIGGSFRIPEVMEQSGALLREVGTTNRTRISDYEKAITENTAALMKVHTSNYRILGFTETVSAPSLAELAHRHHLVFINDLGSGNMVDLSAFGLPKEPTVRESVASGADIVTFSGDKLLGGPQAGIIIGKAELIEKIKRHPLMRALRVDKMTLAALEYVLKLYLDPETAIKEIPVLKGLSIPVEQIKHKAERLYGMVMPNIKRGECIEVVSSKSIVGGGALPLAELDTWCVAVAPPGVSCEQSMARLRRREIPVIPRVYENRLFFDMRTVDDLELDELATAITGEINNQERECD